VKKTVYTITLLILWPVLIYAGSQQTSGINAQTVIDRARSIYNDVSDNFVSDSELLAFLNWGLVDIATRSKCLETTETITLQAGVTQYLLSGNYISVEGAVYSGLTTYSSPYKSVTPTKLDAIGDLEAIGIPDKFVVWDDYIVVLPTPESGASGYNMAVYMAGRPSSVTLSETIPTPAIYDKALSVLVAAHIYLRAENWNGYTTLMNLYSQEIDRWRTDTSGQKPPQ